MKIVIKLNPIPAVRMTQRGMYVDPAAKNYVEFKTTLAQELRLHLMGDVQGGKLEVTDKWNKPDLPSKRLIKMTAWFRRDSGRRCDIDNLLKMAMDVLQTAGLLYNDDQIREVHGYLEKNLSLGSFTLELKYLD